VRSEVASTSGQAYSALQELVKQCLAKSHAGFTIKEGQKIKEVNSSISSNYGAFIV
jgi:hypothetical protein